MTDRKKKKDAARADESAPAQAPAPEARPRNDAAHLVRGLLVLVVGVVSAFLLMANHDRFDAQRLSLGPWLAAGSIVVAVLGLLDVLRLLSASAYRPAELAGSIDWRATSIWRLEGEPLWMAPIVTVPSAIVLFAILAIAGGVSGLPIAILGGLLVIALSAIRRPALIVFTVCSAVILPFLGTYGLWDPWETHYGEVAREILSRDDWISLWWAQEDWFWSKPIFIFWIESISMALMGIDFHPDAHPANPEWALRLPHYFLAIGALIALYAMVQKAFGKRAGVLAAIVLCTMPHYFFLSHQAITDMPFVSTMTMAMSMLGLALQEDPSREVKRYRLGPIVLSAQHALVAVFALACIPQILLLITRNVTLVTGGFAWHRDRFMFGSAGNGGNPGNAEVREVAPAFDDIAAQPAVQGLIWLVAFVAIVWMLRRERRAQSLYMFAFYFFCALSFMAKGIPGFALPGMVALFWLIASRRWDVLLTGQLRVARGILVVATVGLPWYVAMYLRHGQGFTDRLLVHDHINRLTAGVHGDTGSVEYFFEQLGFGLFPWIALAPIAIAAWVLLGGEPQMRSTEAPETASYRALGEPSMVLDASARSRREILMLIGLWGTSAFVLFSAMTTKFHHYIFPAVPACGALVGIALDRLMGERSDLESPTWQGVVGTITAAVAPVPIAIGIAGIWGDVRGVVPESITGAAMHDWVLRHPWYPVHTIGLIALGMALFALSFWLLRPEAKTLPAKDEGASRWLPAAASSGLFAAPAIVSLVGRDLSWVTSSRPAGYERLIHLFVYNYGRPWPEHLDYRPILTGFAITAGVLVGLAAIPVVRQIALRAFLGMALAFAVWCLDVYIVDLSPHWGQRELLEEYYRQRGGPDEEIIAWQMNWKGENFYTGNRVYAFVDLDNRRLNDWLQDHPGETVWFLLEHARLASLRGVLRGAEVTAVTDERLDNKFVLVRARLAAPPRPRVPTRLE